MTEQSLTGRTLGPYRVDRLVGKGACGAVYRAHSTEEGPAGEAGSLVALKVFHTDVITDERAFLRFEREAELGLRIRHPHIVPTYDCGVAVVDNVQLHYMAMQFVEGETLRDVLDELGSLPEDLLYQATGQVLDALATVHAEGMVHRDVKPENVILTRENQVRVMDLGVARLQQEGRDLTHDGEFIGSLAYAAPEQFIDQDHVGPRADLYSVGVLLYEMATGVNPYDEPDLRTLIEKKLRLPVRRPRLLNRSLEPFLDEVILTCLDVEPDARFASAGQLRKVLEERETGAWWSARIEGEAFPAATRALASLRTPRDTALVGRDEQVAALHEAFERARSGTTTTTLLPGGAGVGKTRLVHDVFEDLTSPDGPVLLSGRCPQDVARAHHALVEAVRGYVGESPEEASAKLAALLPDRADFAEGLAGACTGTPVPFEDDAFGMGVAALLSAVAADRPVVLALEDLQYADPSTLAAVGHVVRTLTNERILIILTWRPEDADEGSPVHELTTMLAARGDTVSVPLGPLDRHGIEALLTALLGTPRTVRSLSWPLSRASAGNPHFLIEIVNQLRDSEALAEAPDGWTLTTPIEDVVLPESLRLLLLLRLVDVEPDLMQLLEAASAQGPSFDATLLATVTGQKRLRLLKRLAVLERRHGIVESAGRRAFRFASHGLWQVIHEAMQPERRRELHALCAGAIRAEEATDPEAAFAYVGHMLAAERLDGALEDVPAAIEYAATHVHAVQGVEFLERLLAVEGATPADKRFTACMQLARLRRLLGQPDAAYAALEDAARSAAAGGARGAQGRVACELADTARLAGDASVARSHAEQALALAEEDGSRGLRAQALHTLGRVAITRGDHARSADHLREAAALFEQLGDRRGAAASALELGRVLPVIGETEAAAQARAAALAGFRAVGDLRGEAAALNAVGDEHIDAGRPSRARECYEQALLAVREIGDLPGEAQTLRNLARTHALDARIEDARTTFLAALDMVRQLNDLAGEVNTLDELGSLLATVGDHDAAIGYLEEASESAIRTGQAESLSRVRRHLGNVRHEAGDVDAAWVDYDQALELATPRQRVRTLADMGNAALRQGDAERAVSLLTETGVGIAPCADQLLADCRLARALYESGRTEEARASAVRLEAALDALDEGVPPPIGPELYYSLAKILTGEERAETYLVRANALLDDRLRAIRTVAYREHYLTARWPNREILLEVRALRT